MLDLMLPGVTGEEVLSQIRGIPVIVISGKAEVDDKVNVLLAGIGTGDRYQTDL